MLTQKNRCDIAKFLFEGKTPYFVDIEYINWDAFDIFNYIEEVLGKTEREKTVPNIHFVIRPQLRFIGKKLIKTVFKTGLYKFNTIPNVYISCTKSIRGLYTIEFIGSDLKQLFRLTDKLHRVIRRKAKKLKLIEDSKNTLDLNCKIVPIINTGVIYNATTFESELYYKPITVEKKEIKSVQKQQLEQDIKSYFDKPDRNRLFLVYGSQGSGKSESINQIILEYAQKDYLVVYINNLGDYAYHKYYCKKNNIKTIIVFEEADLILKESAKHFLSGQFDIELETACLTIAITNHPKDIDNTILLRPGRVDEFYEFNEMYLEDIVYYVNKYYPNHNYTENGLKLIQSKFKVAAYIIEVLKIVSKKEDLLTDEALVKWTELYKEKLDKMTKSTTIKADFLESKDKIGYTRNK